MSLAAWKPGQAPDWRTALKSWYSDARLALSETHRVNTAVHADIVVGAARFAKIQFIVSASTEEFLAAVTEHDERLDAMLRSTQDSHVIERDRLTASYLAGLAAGGDDVAWVDWLQTRASTWQNTQAAKATHLILMSESRSPVWQRLPDYS